MLAGMRAENPGLGLPWGTEAATVFRNAVPDELRKALKVTPS